MRTLKVCLALCIVFFISPGFNSPEELSSLEGMVVWENENPSYAILSRLVIDNEMTRIRAYEACDTGDCSWGWAELEAVEGGYLARYGDDIVNYELFLRELDGDKIHLSYNRLSLKSFDGDILINAPYNAYTLFIAWSGIGQVEKRIIYASFDTFKSLSFISWN